MVSLLDVSAYVHGALHSRSKSTGKVPLKHLYLLAQACTASRLAALDRLRLSAGESGQPASDSARGRPGLSDYEVAVKLLTILAHPFVVSSRQR